MSKQITNDEMGMVLVSFWSNDNGESEYDDFRNYWSGVVGMAVDRYLLGWVAEITDKGYEQIQQAYNELVKLGWLDEDELETLFDE